MQTLIGVIYESENNADGMQNILDHLQKFVPSYEREGTIQYTEQGIVGDQLTVERGVNGLFEVSNGFTAEERHEGLHFEVADFHGGMKFLEVNHIDNHKTQMHEVLLTCSEVFFNHGYVNKFEKVI